MDCRNLFAERVSEVHITAGQENFKLCHRQKFRSYLQFKGIKKT